ncbi:MAG: hypothetical protein R3B90_03875 [Planctomycetaceae bacterium]
MRLRLLRLLSVGLCVAIALVHAVYADGPADNNSEQVRQIPPAGVELPEGDRARLTLGLEALAAMIDQARSQPGPVAHLLPDVEIFHRAVRQAVEFGEFFRPEEIRWADELLAEGMARAQALLDGDAPWTRQTGLVVRGYRSRLDDTVQPYGLVIPDDYDFQGTVPSRCDLWFHGRGETMVVLQFIHQRMSQPGAIKPTGGIVLHPFGRYSNAFKFAGEVDVWEALEHADAIPH